MKEFAVAFIMIGSIFLSGCYDKTPVAIEFALPPDVIINSEPFSLNAFLKNKDGAPLLEQQVAYAAVPTEIISVSENKFFCKKNGDA